MGEIRKAAAGRVKDLVHLTLPPQPYWIEPFILPKRGMMLFGGEAKVGKSMVMLELCKSLATGEPPFGVPDFSVPEPARVLLIECELGLYGLKDRVNKIVGSSLDPVEVEDNFWYVSKDPYLNLSSREGVLAVSNLVQEIKPNVLCIDPIGKFHSADENSNSEVAKVLGRLEKIQKDSEGQDMSLVISHHFGKPAKEDSRFVSASDGLSPYEFRGASKWFDNPDTLVTMKRVAELKNGGWRLRSRWTLRHGAGRPDMLITINKHGRLEARYEGPASMLMEDPEKDKEEAPKGKESLFKKGSTKAL